ncbi:hypothetical protein LTR70_010767 [Exophiala xenobiotica]|nr:hypothetical protein LTR70_010767 [Exophiala xenobiotica]
MLARTDETTQRDRAELASTINPSTEQTGFSAVERELPPLLAIAHVTCACYPRARHVLRNLYLHFVGAPMAAVCSLGNLTDRTMLDVNLDLATTITIMPFRTLGPSPDQWMAGLFRDMHVLR